MNDMLWNRLMSTCVLLMMVLVVVVIWSPSKWFSFIKWTGAHLLAVMVALILIVIWGGVHP